MNELTPCDLPAYTTYLLALQVVVETATAAAKQVATTAPAVAHSAARVGHVGAKAAKRTK